MSIVSQSVVVALHTSVHTSQELPVPGHSDSSAHTNYTHVMSIDHVYTVVCGFWTRYAFREAWFEQDSCAGTPRCHTNLLA